KCQKFAPLIHQLAADLNPISSPWPFAQWSAKASNKTILDGIKKRLKVAKGKWVEELSNVLWAYWTTLRRSTRKSLFVMAYGTE
ncbi:hypothetical protein LOK49_LG03G00891, partial [Camellia lanceoleosa]